MFQRNHPKLNVLRAFSGAEGAVGDLILAKIDFSAISADFRFFEIFLILTKIDIFDDLVRPGGDHTWLVGLGSHSSIM